MSYLNDPREMAIRPESGITLEEDNRIETMWHWGAMVRDLCDLPVEEYMKPMTVIGVGGGGGDDEGGEGSSTTKTYALKRMLDGRTYGETLRLEEGAPIPEVEVSKEGYDFSGWADKSGNTPTVMPAAALTLYGTTTIKKFTVKFIVDGNELPEYEQTINYGSKVTNLPSSAKTGYSFSGWEPEIPASIKNNYTFVGSFEKKSYTVSFNISGDIQTATFEYGDTIEYPAADSKEGYTICGWTPSNVTTMPDNENLTFKATLTANPYTLRYLISGVDGADDEVVYSTTVRCGQSIPSRALPVQSGYSFTSWATDSQITGNKMPAHDVDFRTNKTANVYTLSYFINGTQSGQTEQYPYGSTVVPRAKYEQEGYTVTDWSFVPALKEIPQELGGGYSMPYYNVKASCTTRINSYYLELRHRGELILSGNVEYNTNISELIPDGYSYSGSVETMPASNATLNVDINSYVVTVNIPGKSPIDLQLEYKSDIKSAVIDYIENNFADELVGHHIDTNIPQGATVPTHDVSYSASIVPNQHRVTVVGNSGTTVITLNYGDNILNAVSGIASVDEFHYIDGWTINGQPLGANDTMPDEDVVVRPVIKTKESEVTPVISGDSSDSIVIDYGTPVSEIIENIIASASEQTKADLVDPGYEVEWTVNGSAYTSGSNMVIKEDEVEISVTITPKPFKLSFMRRGNAVANAGVVNSGTTLYKVSIEYPGLPESIVVDGVTYEFKWDDDSIVAGTPMPARDVTVYGEYIEKPISNTVYYGCINYRKLANLTEDSPEVLVLSTSEGMPASKKFELFIAYDPSYAPIFADWTDEEIDDDEFIEILNSNYALSPIILLPESIDKEDYSWKRGDEVVKLTFVKNMTIEGYNYKLWYEPHMGGSADGYTVEGYYAPNEQGIDATISFESKN